MQLSVPRLLGIVAACEALYFLGRTVVRLTYLDYDDGAWLFGIAAGVVWMLLLAGGAYVLWLTRRPASLLEAIVRTALIWLVIAFNALTVIGLLL